MQNATTVIKKLKKLLEIKTDLELSDILKVKPNTISSWKKRNSLQYEGIIEICKEHRIDLNELFLKESTIVKSNSFLKKQVKMISLDHQFEYFLDSEKVLKDAPKFVFPTTEEVDMAFQVASENMYPTLKVSSYVITKKIDIKDIQPWHLYLFVLKGRGLMTYRFKRVLENNHLLFVSDNSSYENLDVAPSDIIEIFCIRGAFLPNFKGIGDL
ncbi:LexA family transcriptional regulator [Myroides phaeus]|uniref:Bacteriophage CI repressor helix-turn-helix domain-containing protein n=1 Tax=Myroides phaeus TaxID=702745 RepID=A0A1G8CY27_9FLAO|nr:helix-turn-helix domain-containing protein [Myroides phaeus]MEC4116224.1 helix-turn-helix domain-containing protein [Myroides phaeus]SDH50355.1 Bacteriophage CI repressor helix-turn-helix domain-containing protein [Myroides phaeus]